MTTYPTSSPEELETALDAATLAVRQGRIVVLPTDTVYGVGADAFDAAAVRRLLAAKGRGREMPPPVLVSAPTTADALARGLSDAARALIERFWPGPLTVVATQQSSLSWDLGETRGTVAIRMPDHPIALALLERTGPMAVTSANLTGRPAATTAADAERMLGESVTAYVDGGHSTGTQASTIVDVTGDVPQILRRGVITAAELDEALAALGVAVVDEG